MQEHRRARWQLLAGGHLITGPHGINNPKTERHGHFIHRRNLINNDIHTQTGPWGLGGHFKCVCDNMCRDEIKRENVCVQNLRQRVLQKNDKQNHFQVQATNLPYEKLWKCLTKLQHIKDWVWNNAGFCKLVWFLFLSPTHLIDYLTSNSDKQDESTAWVKILLECVCLTMKCDSVSQLVIKWAWKKKKRTRCSCCERSGNDKVCEEGGGWWL